MSSNRIFRGNFFWGVVVGNAFPFFSLPVWLIIIPVLNNWILGKPTFLSLGDGVVAIRRRDLVEVFYFNFSLGFFFYCSVLIRKNVWNLIQPIDTYVWDTVVCYLQSRIEVMHTGERREKKNRWLSFLSADFLRETFPPRNKLITHTHKRSNVFFFFFPPVREFSCFLFCFP